MASLNDVFPEYGENFKTKPRMELNQNNRQASTCPTCSQMAIRYDIHMNLRTCPYGHQWQIGDKGEKYQKGGMFFDRPSKPENAENNAQFRQFVKGPAMDPNQLMQMNQGGAMQMNQGQIMQMNNPYHNAASHQMDYEQLIRNQYQHLERPRDLEQFEWSMRTQRNPPF